MAEICTRTLSILATACSRIGQVVADSHPMAKQDLGLNSNVPRVTRPGLNLRRWPSPGSRISLMLPEPSHMVVKFLLGRCFHIPAGHLVCGGGGGNSLQAKSVNLKKKIFPPFFTTPRYSGLISHCSLLFKLPVNFLKVYLCKGKISFNLFYYFKSWLLETVQRPQKCHLL